MSDVTDTGVYYGFARVIWTGDEKPGKEADAIVLPMVMSLGWNPFYKNERMTAVCHEMKFIMASVGLN